MKHYRKPNRTLITKITSILYKITNNHDGLRKYWRYKVLVYTRAHKQLIRTLTKPLKRYRDYSAAACKIITVESVVTPTGMTYQWPPVVHTEDKFKKCQVPVESFPIRSLVRVINVDHIWYNKIGTVKEQRGLFYLVNLPDTGNVLIPSSWLVSHKHE